ncbi:serine hydrolase domain-containing protein [Roseivirga sp.]|uniref:serine hydrolase domain-containing protein n=1 Tax=Roseivirga sp. TaxID=1964215 RepID=UPI003B519B0A
MKRIFTLTIVALLTSLICSAQTEYRYTQPQLLGDGWETANLKSTAFDTTRLYAFFNQLTKEDHELHGMLLVDNNQLVLEEYFNGYNASQPHDLRSVSKSIISILLGIAIDEGIIDDINDPISKYLKSHNPEKNLDNRKNEITIEHLLTMSAGWDCNDWDKNSQGQEDRIYKKKDWIQYTLDLPVINDPGSVSNYCTMGVVILAEIISQASGLSIDQFAREFLFEPLGIKDYQWGHTSKKEVIESGKRLYLTPRDLAKIGQLILDQGRWNGRQIVSASWIEAATTSHTSITGVEYGYLWWNIPFHLDGKALVSKTATGNGGQYIMVIPEINIVAVFTGGAYNSQGDKLAFAIIQNVLLPSLNPASIKPEEK